MSYKGKHRIGQGRHNWYDWNEVKRRLERERIVRRERPLTEYLVATNPWGVRW